MQINSTSWHIWILYLACVSGMMVGGLGGCCGTISPRRVDIVPTPLLPLKTPPAPPTPPPAPPPPLPLWCSEISPAERSEITPVPSPQFGWAVVKHTRPPCTMSGSDTNQSDDLRPRIYEWLCFPFPSTPFKSNSHR